MGGSKRWITAWQFGQTGRKSLDRIQSVGPARARGWTGVVNLNVIGGFRSILSKKVEPANEATPTVMLQTRLAGFLISFIRVYDDLAYGPPSR